MESNELKLIFANKRNCGKRFGAFLQLPQGVLISSIKPISSSILLRKVWLAISAWTLGTDQNWNLRAGWMKFHCLPQMARWLDLGTPRIDSLANFYETDFFPFQVEFTILISLHRYLRHVMALLGLETTKCTTRSFFTISNSYLVWQLFDTPAQRLELGYCLICARFIYSRVRTRHSTLSYYTNTEHSPWGAWGNLSFD